MYFYAYVSFGLSDLKINKLLHDRVNVSLVVIILNVTCVCNEIMK